MCLFIFGTLWVRWFKSLFFLWNTLGDGLIPIRIPSFTRLSYVKSGNETGHVKACMPHVQNRTVEI